MNGWTRDVTEEGKAPLQSDILPLLSVATGVSVTGHLSPSMITVVGLTVLVTRGPVSIVDLVSMTMSMVPELMTAVVRIVFPSVATSLTVSAPTMIVAGGTEGGEHRLLVVRCFAVWEECRLTMSGCVGLDCVAGCLGLCGRLPCIFSTVLVAGCAGLQKSTLADCVANKMVLILAGQTVIFMVFLKCGHTNT